MIRGIYATATGMMASEKKLDVIANNLANVSTVGYKRDGISFAESCEREMFADSGTGASLGTLGSGPTESSRYTVFEPGSPMPTGNSLDVMVSDAYGAFAVEVARTDGSTQVYYTRDGSFSLNDQRQLVTKTGNLVLDESLQPITLPSGIASIGADGTVSANEATVGKLGVFEGRYVKTGANLFSPATDASGRATTPTLAEKVVLKTQTIEGSNVNAISSMVEMITLNRSYELAQKSIQKQDDLTQQLIQSLQKS
jgi:flagellar basal-body rod protein FlgF